MTNQPEAAALPLTLAQFEPEVGSTFIISFTNARFELELSEATALKYHDPKIHARPPFSLLFVCPDERVIEQGSYVIEHERLGMLEFFIVPINADADGVHYEAIFN